MKQIEFWSRGNPDYRFLGNFYPCPIDHKGTTWPSAEHLFVACKTEDPTERAWVHQAKDAREARQRGKQVTLRPDWAERKVGFMRAILRLKFTQNPELRNMLLDTDGELVHHAPWDGFWGTGRDGRGQNMLGQLLMEIRAELKEE